MTRNRVGLVAGIVAMVLVVLSGVVWLMGSRNPSTPAGYVGYLTQGAVFGQTRYYGLQEGPVSSGRTWLLNVANVSFTPYTYTEEFSDNNKENVLAADNLSIGFRIHLVFKMRKDQIKDFMENYSYINQGSGQEDSSDYFVRVAYNNYVKEPLRKFARDEVRRYKGLEVKNNMTEIGNSIENQIRAV